MNITMGDAIKRAMNKRGVTGVELAAQLGIRSATLSDYRRGAVMPSTVVVAALAEALNWPSLIARGQALRARHCLLPDCGREFSAENSKKQYCSVQCVRTRWARIKRETVHEKLMVTKVRLDLHQKCVRDTCYTCAEDRVCRDAGCPLRPVSPLMLPLAHRVIPLGYEIRRKA